MRILITGGTGFIGHHLIEFFLKNTSHSIIILDRLDFTSTLHRIIDIECFNNYKYRIKFVYHDLKSELNDFIINKIGNLDGIYHLAASSHVDRSIINPMSFVMDNIVGTVNLLEYARKINLSFYCQFSTDEVVGPALDDVLFKEDAQHLPKNPYAATKASAEDMCIAYQNTYKIPIFITRTMNVFGERQHPEKFIPMCISKILNNDEVLIHSHSDLIRAGSRFYIHARNVASALCFLTEKFKSGEIYNIVGEKEVDNLSLAKLIAKILGKDLKYKMVDFHSSRPGHDLRYGLDRTKMKNMGWELPINFENSLEKTINWYLKNKEWLLSYYFRRNPY